MKKVLYTLILLGYIFSVSSLTHVFAMTNELFHHDMHMGNEISMSHSCCNSSNNNQNSGTDSQEDSGMNCCETIFSSEYFEVKLDLNVPLDNGINTPIWISLNNFLSDFNKNFVYKSDFSPPGWKEKEKKFISYDNLVGIIKSLI